VSVEFSPYAYDIHDDPYPVYKRLRDEAPAYYNAELRFWTLSRFADVFEAMQDWQTYSSAAGVSLEKSAQATPPMIISMDPPRQVKLRRLISLAFTPRRIALLEPKIRQLTVEYLQPLVERREFDLIKDFAAKVPMDVISTMLGVPRGDQDRVRGWADILLHREPNRAEIPPEGVEGARSLAGYFAGKLAERRRQPSDDMISALIGAEIDGERLADAEIIGFCFLLAIAGNETTTKMIGNAIYWLSRNPAQRRLIVDDPALIAAAVEEVTRYDNSTQMLARVLARDVDMHGRRMPAGDRVLLLLGAANRDEREFRDPDVFDVRRRIERTVAFGHGVHVCLGAALARLEGRVVLEEIHARMPQYEIDEASLERVHSANVRGYASMRIRGLRGRG
jgi:cytochrome P450